MNHNPLEIPRSFWDEDSDQDLEALLRQHGGYGCLFFYFPTCRNHSDIAEYYLEAAFVGQLLHNVSDDVSYTEESDGYHGSVYVFSFHIESYDNIQESFDILGQLLSEENYEPVGELEDFRDILGLKQVAFPELVDFYFANLLASNYDWLEEHRNEIYSKHPEWAYHCWLSANSPECGYPLYVSPRFWLIPAGTSVGDALKFGSDIDSSNITLEYVSSVFTFDNNICLLGKGKTAIVSNQLHLQILEIASLVFPVDYDPGSSYWSQLPSASEFKISSNMDFLICEGDTFTYILFRGNFLFAGQKERENIRAHIQKWLEGVELQAGFMLKYKCNWALLDDESFELACYDLARRDGRFAPSKTKKMGLAKSRDGGRDILAYTPSLPGSGAKKWIIQCKHSLSKRTLGRNSIQLAELIDEYSPDGVIVATDLIVDAGLHDKIESIAKNRNVEIEVWDALEIERRINQHPDLFRIYFEEK